MLPMTKHILFVMDPIQSLIPHHDSTIALMRASLNLGHQVSVTGIEDLLAERNQAFAITTTINEINLKQDIWYKMGGEKRTALTAFDLIMMRKDPPFNMRYIFATYLLELAEKQGVTVYNKPRSLRDYNEKLSILDFPDCITDTVVTARYNEIKPFYSAHGDIILKPLDGMGGKGIFRVNANHHNLKVIVETLTNGETQPIMVQKYLTDVTAGDKRVLLINGEPLPYALLRLAPNDDFRANLAVGGDYKTAELCARDKWICQQLKSTLRQKGLFFVGIDIIGDYLTEINVTCPTGIRELDATNNMDIGMTVMNSMLNKPLS